MEDETESPEDLYFSRLIFVQALDALIQPGHGVFVVLHGEALDLGIQRVIVHNNPDTNEIGVIVADERTDLKHGDRVEIIQEDTIIN